MQQPSVGRIVHYVSEGSPARPDGTQKFTSQCRAAVVTEVTEHPDADGTAGLCVLNPGGLFFHPLAAGGSPHDESEPGTGGTWHWPEPA